jgi:hypothetical protein
VDQVVEETVRKRWGRLTVILELPIVVVEQELEEIQHLVVLASSLLLTQPHKYLKKS